MNNRPPLQFKILDANSGCFSRDWDGEEKVDNLRSQLRGGAITHEAALMAARRMVRQEPDNLDAQQFLALRYWDGGMKDEAAALWAPLFARVSALIPPDFKGRIDWSELDNRPFLRLAHSQLLGLMHLGAAPAASKLSKRLLAWTPEDNLGVRYLQPLIAVMGGHHKTAYKQFLKIAPEMPTGWYHAARIAFRDEQFVTALTLLRRGILANPYIAEAITGRRVLFSHLHWHRSNRADHSMAQSFLETEFEGWAQEDIDFVDWGFNCAMVMRERAAAAEINEGLTFEFEPAARQRLVDIAHQMDAAITDDSSAGPIRKVKNRHGHEHWPWDRVGALHPGQRGWSAEQAAFFDPLRDWHL